MARMSVAGQIFAPRQLLLHCLNPRHSWRSSTGIPRTLNTAKFLKLGIAAMTSGSGVVITINNNKGQTDDKKNTR